MTNELTIKDYAIEYQRGNDDILIELIQLRGKNGGDKLFLKDKKLNEFLQSAISKYGFNVDRTEIEAFMLEFLISIDEEGNKIGILDKIDTSLAPSQIVNYVFQSWNGFIKDKLETLLFNENVITDETLEEFDEVDTYSLYDNQSFNDWEEVSYSTSYEKFLETVGGLQKVLTKRQFEITTLSTTKSQKEIADELDLAQTTISTTMKQAHNKLKKAYINWRALEILSSKEGRSQNETIKQFLNEIDKITKYDIDNSFNYFSYIVEFLIENKTKDDFRLNIKDLQKNKMNLSTSIIEVIEDNIKRSQHNLVGKVLEVYVNDRKEDTLSNQDKNRFSRAIINSLHNHIENNAKNITEGLDTIIDHLAKRNNERTGRIKNNDYKEVINILTA